METLVGVIAGTCVGYGAARVHARVDGGWWLNLLAAALGGYVGLHLWTEAFAVRLADSSLAGAAVAGAVGGAALALIAGIGRHVLAWDIGRRRGASEAADQTAGADAPALDADVPDADVPDADAE